MNDIDYLENYDVDNNDDIDATDFSKMTLAQLKQYAKDNNIKGYTRYKKKDEIAMYIENYKPPQQQDDNNENPLYRMSMKELKKYIKDRGIKGTTRYKKRDELIQYLEDYKPPAPKKGKLYYKIGDVPNGYQRANMKEAVDNDKVLYWGLHKVDNKLLQPLIKQYNEQISNKSNKPKKTSRDKVMKEISKLKGRLKRFKGEVDALNIKEKLTNDEEQLKQKLLLDLDATSKELENNITLFKSLDS